MSKVVSDLLKEVMLPKMFRVRQLFPRESIIPEKIPELIDLQLSQDSFREQIRPGMRIAITASSRGITNAALITKSIVDFVKRCGAFPFVVPAMGSHGGATAEGQRQILADYGIVEEYIGCPILSSMEVKWIGTTEDGRPVRIDKYAAEADGIIINCRIKLHTEFRGPYESGIMKMMAIGLGKQVGAEACHEAGFKNMAQNVPIFGKAILQNAPILFAVAAIENAYDETSKIVAIHSSEIEEQEPKLLKEAASLMSRILVDSCDVLVVDQIGKNFSGDGMDPNVTGTFATPYASGGIKSQHVVVLGLSKETHGNALGIGMASATTMRVYREIDTEKMYPNSITSTLLNVSRIPVVMDNDREAIQICVKVCIEIDKNNPRIVRIPNSLQLEHILLSESYYQEAMANPLLEIESEPEVWKFNENGNLW